MLMHFSCWLQSCWVERGKLIKISFSSLKRACLIYVNSFSLEISTLLTYLQKNVDIPEYIASIIRTMREFIMRKHHVLCTFKICFFTINFAPWFLIHIPKLPHPEIKMLKNSSTQKGCKLGWSREQAEKFLLCFFCKKRAWI